MNGLTCDLSRCFLCQHCSEQWRELIALKKNTQLFRKARKIFEEGDPVRGMFFIYEGAVKVSQNWGSDKELILRFAGSGHVLGHRGFGSTPVYPISATALEDTRLCFIPNDFLEASLKTNPSLMFQLLDLYASDLQKAEKRMRDLAHREGRGRIILALFEIAQVFGHDSEGFVRLPLTRQDIASFAGTSYESVFKAFSEWSANGLVSFSGKAIRLNNEGALREMLQDQSILS